MKIVLICGSNPTVTELIDYKQFCGIDSITHKIEYEEMDVTELKKHIYKLDLHLS